MKAAESAGPLYEKKEWDIEKIKHLLKSRRHVLGLTQQQVADRAGVRLRHYQQFEGGERSIMTCSFDTACRIIETLEMNITKFYHGEYFSK